MATQIPLCVTKITYYPQGTLVTARMQELQIRTNGRMKYFYKWSTENRVEVSNGGMGVKYASFEHFASR